MCMPKKGTKNNKNNEKTIVYDTETRHFRTKNRIPPENEKRLESNQKKNCKRNLFVNIFVLFRLMHVVLVVVVVAAAAACVFYSVSI